MKPKIIAFDNDHGRYFWTVEYDGIPGIDPADRVERHFRTNRDGEGLWQGDRQILGTGQYRLPADRKRARAKVYRDFVTKTDNYGVRL